MLIYLNKIYKNDTSLFWEEREKIGNKDKKPGGVKLAPQPFIGVTGVATQNPKELQKNKTKGESI